MKHHVEVVLIRKICAELMLLIFGDEIDVKATFHCLCSCIGRDS